MGQGPIFTETATNIVVFHPVVAYKNYDLAWGCLSSLYALLYKIVRHEKILAHLLDVWLN